MATQCGIPPDWAFVNQVHGHTVLEAERPGPQGEGDAIFTTEPGLALAVATADCVPVVIEGPDVAAVVHAGWRGAAAEVAAKTLARLREEGLHPERAAIGPSIGPCCYEVGDEVAARFSAFVSKTSWDSTSVNLRSVLRAQLNGLNVWTSKQCTYTDPSLHSYRQSRTVDRQVSVAWLPAG